MDDLARDATDRDRRRRPRSATRARPIAHVLDRRGRLRRHGMAEISRADLFGKLNPLMFKAAEGAVAFCKLRGNPHVELAHWLFQIINLPDSDLHRILRHFEIDSSRLVRDLQTMLERLPRGASAIEDFSEHVPYAVKEGWMYATLLFG